MDFQQVLDDCEDKYGKQHDEGEIVHIIYLVGSILSDYF